MNLKEFIYQLNKIQDDLKDRKSEDVEVLIVNKEVKILPDILNRNFNIRLISFERYHEPPSIERSEWVKQVRIG